MERHWFLRFTVKHASSVRFKVAVLAFYPWLVLLNSFHFPIIILFIYLLGHKYKIKKKTRACNRGITVSWRTASLSRKRNYTIILVHFLVIFYRVVKDQRFALEEIVEIAAAISGFKELTLVLGRTQYCRVPWGAFAF